MDQHNWSQGVPTPNAPMLRVGACPELDALYQAAENERKHLGSTQEARTEHVASPTTAPHPWGSASYFKLGTVAFSPKHDIVAASLAFALPLLYDQAAPKKWNRPGMLGSLVAVAGIYLASRWALVKWWKA